MDENNSSKTSLASVLLVFAIIIILIMGFCIFKLYNDKQIETQKYTDLEAQVTNLNEKLNKSQKKPNIVKEKDDNDKTTINGRFAQNLPGEDTEFQFDAGEYVFKEDETVENQASATKYGTYTIKDNIINIHWTKVEDDEIDENSEMIIKDENTLLVIDYKKEKGNPINWVNGSVFYKQSENNTLDTLTEDDDTTSNSESKYITYSKDGIEFKYPSTFKQTDDTFITSGFEAIQDNNKNGFQIKSTTLSPSDSLKDIVESQKNLDTADGTKFRSTEKEEKLITLPSGIKGYRFECKTIDNSYQIFFITQKDNKAYQFTFTINDKDKYNDYIETANNIFDSINMK